MAKRRRLRVPKHPVAAPGEEKRLADFAVAKLLHPTPIQRHPGLARAHVKHQSESNPRPTETTLADRFHALPPELRAYVFSFLLVRPGKWDMEHELDCPLYDNPRLDIVPRDTSCVRCSRWYTESGWRQATADWSGASFSPWRSKYAPTIRNDYICSICWDVDFREKVTGYPFPAMSDSMPCLCGRRRDLDLLLVCRRWYHEARRVLWTQNSFAFEDCKTFVDFTRCCEGRNLVSKISILELDRRQKLDRNLDFRWPDWAYHKKRRALISALRRLPSLSHLELDATLLHDVRDVKAMLRLGLRNLRSVRFWYHSAPEVEQNQALAVHDDHFVYSSLRKAKVLLRGGLAEEVARAIKCEHRVWTRHHEFEDPTDRRSKLRGPQKPRRSLLQKAVDRQLTIEEDWKGGDIPEQRIANCDDIESWSTLWWKTEGKLHWSQSYLSFDEEKYEPAGWVEVKQRQWSDVFPFAEMEM